jgi:hydroxymethylglutaryl-CoA lyase
LELRRQVESWLPGERFTGSVARAGLPKTFGQGLHQTGHQPMRMTT